MALEAPSLGAGRRARWRQSNDYFAATDARIVSNRERGVTAFGRFNAGDVAPPEFAWKSLEKLDR